MIDLGIARAFRDGLATEASHEGCSQGTFLASTLLSSYSIHKSILVYYNYLHERLALGGCQISILTRIR